MSVGLNCRACSGLYPRQQLTGSQDLALGRPRQRLRTLVDFVRGEFPTCTFAPDRGDGFVITANVPGDSAIALQTPTRVLDRCLNGTAFVLSSTTQSVVAVRTPGEPRSLLEGSVDDFDRNIFYSGLPPGCGYPMVPVDQIVVVVDVVDHPDWGKFFTSSEGVQVVLHDTGL